MIEASIHSRNGSGGRVLRSSTLRQRGNVGNNMTAAALLRLPCEVDPHVSNNGSGGVIEFSDSLKGKMMIGGKEVEVRLLRNDTNVELMLQQQHGDSINLNIENTPSQKARETLDKQVGNNNIDADATVASVPLRGTARMMSSTGLIVGESGLQDNVSAEQQDNGLAATAARAMTRKFQEIERGKQRLVVAEDNTTSTTSAATSRIHNIKSAGSTATKTRPASATRRVPRTQVVAARKNKPNSHAPSTNRFDGSKPAKTSIDDEDDDDSDVGDCGNEGMDRKRVRLTLHTKSSTSCAPPRTTSPASATSSSSEDEELDDVDHEALRAVAESLNASAAPSPPALSNPIAVAATTSTDTALRDTPAARVSTAVVQPPVAASSASTSLQRGSAVRRDSKARGGGHGKSKTKAAGSASRAGARGGATAAAAHLRTAMAGIVASITAVKAARDAVSSPSDASAQSRLSDLLCAQYAASVDLYAALHQEYQLLESRGAKK
eukprot:m.248349 g.248349  ORF g.248349 m.248349 type:complete len:494 (+) comp19504_c0_seq1:270-1751(+)